MLFVRSLVWYCLLLFLILCFVGYFSVCFMVVLYVGCFCGLFLCGVFNSVADCGYICLGLVVCLFVVLFGLVCVYMCFVSCDGVLLYAYFCGLGCLLFVLFVFANGCLCLYSIVGDCGGLLLFDFCLFFGCLLIVLYLLSCWF